MEHFGHTGAHTRVMECHTCLSNSITWSNSRTFASHTQNNTDVILDSHHSTICGCYSVRLLVCAHHASNDRERINIWPPNQFTIIIISIDLIESDNLFNSIYVICDNFSGVVGHGWLVWRATNSSNWTLLTNIAHSFSRISTDLLLPIATIKCNCTQFRLPAIR